MKHLFLSAALVLGATFSAQAGELDNESLVTNQSMNGTIVVRVDTRTNEASILATDSVMMNEADAAALAKNGSFQKIPAQNLVTELDQDGGASSWYFYGYPQWGGHYGYNYNSMYYYGNWYNPCYSYNYNYYQYYYYSNRWW